MSRLAQVRKKKTIMRTIIKSYKFKKCKVKSLRINRFSVIKNQFCYLKGVFNTLSNIFDGAFMRKKLHHRYSTGF